MPLSLPARVRWWRPWLVYVVLVAAMSALYLPPGSPLHRGSAFNVIGLSAVVAILVGQRLHKPARRLPWRFFAAGQAVFVVGDVLAYNYTRFFHAEQPFPSVADIAYIGVYPLLIAGLVVLVRERRLAGDRGGLIDSAIVATGFGVVSWTSLMAPYAHDGSLGLPTQLISLAYPLMDLAVLTVGIRLAMGPGRRGTAFYLLMGGFAALLATDSVYGWLLLHGGYETGGLLDAGWIVFYCLVGAAALHPSMTMLSERAPEHQTTLTLRRLALLASVVLLAPLVQALHVIAGTYFDLPVVTGGSIVLFLLVAARMAGEASRSAESARRERALHETAVALGSAASREAILMAAQRGAEMLVGSDRSVAVYRGGEEMLEAVVQGQEPAPGLATSWQYYSLPVDVRVKLSARRGAHVPAARAMRAGLVTDAHDGGDLWIAGVTVQRELHGALVVSGASLPASVQAALERLAVEVGLAQESAALTEERLRGKSEARFASLFQNSSDIVAVVARDRTVQYVSTAVERHLGRAVQEVEGAGLEHFVHHDDFLRLNAFLGGALADPSVSHAGIELRLMRSDGTPLDVEALVTNLLDDPNVNGLVLNMREIGERKAFQEQLTHHAFHDPLTGLANRALFGNRVEHALERQPRAEGSSPCFTSTSTTSRRSTIASAMRRAMRCWARSAPGSARVIRGADTAARLGGDEFAILLDGLRRRRHGRPRRGAHHGCGRDSVPVSRRRGGRPGQHRDRARGCRQRALERLGPHSQRGRRDVPREGTRQGQHQVFDHHVHAAALDRLRLKNDLERGIQGGEIVVHYQPVMAIDTGLMAGVEALARWNHPTRGMVSPGDFIPLAEETGLVVPLGKAVLEAACLEAAKLQSCGGEGSPLTMSVNLSARQLQHPEILADVRGAIGRSGIDPSSLLLELTESAMMEDVDAAALRLHELKSLGVRLAVDDFGTGHSSLNYIRQFPIDVLKIDRSFIGDITEPGDIAALVATIVDLAGILGLEAVAEGVETPEQLNRLVDLGCGFAQGFLFHRPMEAAALEAIVSRQAAGRAAAA